MKKVVFTLSLCAASMLFASQSNYKYEFTPVIGGSLSEHNLGYNSNLIVGARIARNFNSWINQVELGIDYTPDQGFGWPTDKKTGVARYYLNAVANLINFSDNTKLYGLVGLGYEDWTREANELGTKLADGSIYNGHNYAKDGGFGQYGIGLKHYWTDNFSTKLEVRDLIRFKKAAHTMIYSLGFGVDFGARNPMPAVVPVVSKIVDSDGDGVPDNLDRCPNTPRGVVVDENGCPVVMRLELGVNFKVNSSTVNSSYNGEIQKVADYVKAHPNYTVLLNGYTSSTGSAKYNLKLSKLRANSVKAVLVEMGVSPNRIETFGYGESNPIASNATAAGRAKNRRVEATFRK